MKKIGIIGAGGRMGRMIAQELLSGEHAATLSATLDRDSTPSERDAAFAGCDAMIDFTNPASLPAHAALAHLHGKALVVGTTGLSPVEEAALHSAAQKAPVLWSANMSLGVNLLVALVEQVAARLGPAYDIEIFEAHHRHKADAPSGTALALAQAAAKGRNVDLKDALVPARYGQIGPRPAGAIGISVFRGGDVVGDHTVTFAGDGERIALSHKASDRSLFAKGAVEAALWLCNRPAGLYSMRDVLGL